MVENSKIEWCHHTVNFWIGCERISPGCDNCYAAAWAQRFRPDFPLWDGMRQRTSMRVKQQALRWDAIAKAAHTRFRVFTNSLADFFDNRVPDRWRHDAWHLIAKTPHLDWLIVTKRPQNIPRMLPDPQTGVPAWMSGWPNVWLGTTAENQIEAERRLPHLLAVPATLRFLSAEPTLGPLCVSDLYIGNEIIKPLVGLTWYPTPPDWPTQGITARSSQKLHWVICGGESGPNARPMDPNWARSLRNQCFAAGVPFFMKQMSGRAPIPADLMVRQFPAIAANWPAHA